MAEIHLLDRETAELIAAGEVVERPSSVVKELVENSIDAGASQITVEILRGGIRRIRVTDNGCGMEEEDVPKAFLRHATSKVADADDLASVATLGFRGEALPSIAAVSRVSVLSRTAEQEIGTAYALAGENAGVLTEAGCPAGTTVTVEDLFYNVPARFKFLKKDITEGAAVAALMDRLALSRPEIAFRFVKERDVRLVTPGNGDLLAAAYAVYGPEFAKSLVPVSHDAEGCRVRGYLTRPECCRPTRSMVHFFVNGRYVKSGTMLAALEESYRNRIMTGRFPGCILQVTLDPSRLDVNIHPAKLEIRFSDERGVFDAVRVACGGALESMRQPASGPDLLPRGRRTGFPSFRAETGEQIRMTSADFRRLAETPETGPAGRQPPVRESDRTEGRRRVPPAEPAGRGTEDRPDPLRPDFPGEGNVVPAENASGPSPAGDPPCYIGEVFSTYLLVRRKDCFYLVDKHAAHERILFNRLVREHGNGRVIRQVLLTPAVFTVSKELHDLALTHRDLLLESGFDVESFGEGTLSVREIPALLSGQNAEDLVLELLRRFRKGNTVRDGALFDDLFHSVACKAAVKGRRFTSAEENRSLTEELFSDPTVRSCPHGRPIVIGFTRNELDRMFGRRG